MGVDYERLIEPYSEATPPANTASKRTPGGQRAWLLKRGIQESIADDAMKSVYTELAAGREFKEKDGQPSGYWLDRYLLETARELQLKSGPKRFGMSDSDLSLVAEFSRNAISYAYWKGVVIGSGVTSLILGVGGYILWR